jgi:ferredoxin-type protein NapF
VVTAISRRQFLRGDYKNKHSSIRPPGAGSTDVFLSLCNRCDACIHACPNALLYRDDGGFPAIRFSGAECEFCGACARACGRDALFDLSLASTDDRAVLWPWRAEITERCLSSRGIACGSCAEQCGYGALNLVYHAGPIPIPVIDAMRCSGCGACIAVCPEQAINLVWPAATAAPIEEE